MCRAFAVCCRSVLLSASPRGQSPTPTADLAADLQRNHTASPTSADFAQYRGGFEQQATERGRLLVKKPKDALGYCPKRSCSSRRTPNLLYIPQDRQVSQRDAAGSTPTGALLTGQRQHHARFNVAFDR
jgi:hypothetical protein